MARPFVFLGSRTGILSEIIRRSIPIHTNPTGKQSKGSRLRFASLGKSDVGQPPSTSFAKSFGLGRTGQQGRTTSSACPAACTPAMAEVAAPKMPKRDPCLMTWWAMCEFPGGCNAVGSNLLVC